ncbi:RTA1 like protein-domain-containing protein [Suillus discolor]|uniref:RTA1 like protein-domain-containing protein n=1 Tax=Suillus discolor TaxID=1912936 RepID=A0A9P7FEG4_9AGAM|nr:RTA1 like protein-domain-containing protein [Suillus discolor]KAG2113873.1 RTA1 like protein-domain-containing protein [Suillus discolor]
MQSANILIIVAFLIGAVKAAGGNSTVSVEAPTIVSTVFKYDPNKAAAISAGVLYSIASLCLFTRLFMNKAWWGLHLPIASTLMSVGLFMRIPMATNPNSLPTFMVQQILTLSPPAAYLAFNYILYSRFIVNCVDRRYSWIKPEKVTWYIIISDMTTSIQGAVISLQASTNPTSTKLGVDILLTGFILQTASFAFFMILVAHAWHCINRDGLLFREEPWGKILWILMFSSTAYMIRYIYRVTEFAQGNGGYLITHEIYFYLLDSLPLLIGICAYIIYWPTKYLEASVKPVYDNEMTGRVQGSVFTAITHSGA